MLINILLLFLAFGATHWKKQPYAGALVLAVIKGTLYALVAIGKVPLWAVIANSAIGFIVFGGLAAGMVYFIRRLDRYEPKEVSYATPGAERAVFKWEYFPIAATVLVMIFGEFLVARSAGRSG